MAKSKTQLKPISINFSNKNLGLSQKKFNAVIARATRSIIATGDKKQIAFAKKYALKAINEGYQGNKLIKLLEQGTKIDRAKGTYRVNLIGGKGNAKSFYQTQANFNLRTLNELQKAGIFNDRTLRNYKKGKSYQKNHKTKKPPEGFDKILEVIKNMGGYAIALDKYLDRIENMASDLGIKDITEFL